MRKSIRKATSLFLLVMGAAGLLAQKTVLPVPGTEVYQFALDVNKVGAEISPDMYGVFFEDINFGADGGLYGELIKNRSFEFEHPFTGWTPYGNVTIQTKNPIFDRNPHYARLSYQKELTFTGLDNEGFRGIGVEEGEKYDLTFYARTVTNDPITLRFHLVNEANDLFEEKKVEVKGKNWTKYSVTLTPNRSALKATFRLVMETKGTVDLEHISLFPQKTYNNRKNGLRADLVQALKDLKPGVFRFPGGCIVEGNDLGTRYQWKHSIGAVENRPININRWNYTFHYKKFNDYYQSYGLGFYEYFLLCEDLDAEPLPVLSCGLACQYENHDPNENCPVDKLQPFIDDALDLIEFANGPATSKWGKIRAEMGHPEPFNMKYLAIGNEQWGELYIERLEPFVKQLREKHPEILIVGGSGPGSEGEAFDHLWPEMKRLEVDLVDEHFYRTPEWFLGSAARYDSYDRNGPKVFAGEYACHPNNRENSFLTALCEAAFMTGMERNADVVTLATYAPLFAHVDAWQWRPDLIWFDNHSVVRTPNYYVQQMYATNPGTHVLSLTMDNQPLTGQKDLYATAALDKKTNELIVKVANTGMAHRRVKMNINGLTGKHRGTLSLLHSTEMEAKNTIADPDQIVPVKSDVEIDAADWQLRLKPFSFSVYRIKL
ncbi:alpha-L-arabinofuranosidase C-terminal domain-containing protein [Parabacteroides sp. PF5-6]|uniref:alpha-L-arabinofuranosidase C-terminal domain-containing protein n=1 Tax=Parabacteroides sp. PF5-6 TaxID=1742403 RepID=UPI0024064E84|nr:alpha-L-arabinofuranosidase C-terminal domain-containing protein [Parabacteroides sp. PF5-6]MDF9831380.1 alpha-N-arabinofuranosidase [Parabacteroides sp. PF5-6]